MVSKTTGHKILFVASEAAPFVKVAIDLLRLEIPNHEVEGIIEKYKQKYREIRGGQPEQRE